jgi:hypothetical protein
LDCFTHCTSSKYRGVSPAAAAAIQSHNVERGKRTPERAQRCSVRYSGK